MMDAPHQGDVDYSSKKPDNLPHEREDVNSGQLVLKQYHGKEFCHTPHEYLAPTITKFNQGAGPDHNEENTYQPLIPPRFVALGDEKSEYQSLTLKSDTLTAKFSVSPIEPAPPVIPPKPKAM